MLLLRVYVQMCPFKGTVPLTSCFIFALFIMGYDTVYSIFAFMLFLMNISVD